MTRLIDKEYLIEEIRCSPVGQLLIRKHNLDGMIEKFPEVDAEPVRHGKWLEMIEVNELGEPYQSGVYCSECGHTDSYEPNYCPNCGSRMDAERKEE